MSVMLHPRLSHLAPGAPEAGKPRPVSYSLRPCTMAPFWERLKAWLRAPPLVHHRCLRDHGADWRWDRCVWAGSATPEAGRPRRDHPMCKQQPDMNPRTYRVVANAKRVQFQPPPSSQVPGSCEEPQTSAASEMVAKLEGSHQAPIGAGAAAAVAIPRAWTQMAESLKRSELLKEVGRARATSARRLCPTPCGVRHNL